MKRQVSIVAARRELGRLAEEVGRTGQGVTLTKRGRAVARIVPEPRSAAARSTARDGFAALRGTVRLHCSFNALRSAIRELRDEFTQNLDRRAAAFEARRRRRRG
jgi:prevent-host-death family protein